MMLQRAERVMTALSLRRRRGVDLPHASSMHDYGSLFHPAFMSEIFNN